MVLDRELTDIATGRTKRLIVQMPPRHGKSLLTAKYFPAWYLGVYGTKSVMLASATDELAMDFSGQARDCLMEHGWMFGTTMKKDNQSRQFWQLESGGGLRAGGIGSGNFMGRPADCLSGDMIVQTEDGPQRIDTVVQLQYTGRVLSYDHALCRAVWRRILAHRVVHGRQVIEIRSRSGRTLRCTPEHRVYSDQCGYGPANTLRAGDRIKAACLPELRRARYENSNSMPQMLPLSAAHGGYGNVPLVPQAIRETEIRQQQAYREGENTRLLQPSLLAGTQRNRVQASLHSVRRPGIAKDAKVLRAMQAASKGDVKEAGHQNVPAMQCDIPAEDKQAGLLLQDVCQSSPRRVHDRNWKLSLQTRSLPPGDCAEDASVDLAERRKEVRWLRTGGRTGGDKKHATTRRAAPLTTALTSYRRKPAQQCSRKPCDVVPRLPHEAPQVESDTIHFVGSVCTECEPVYDIQVEGAHNFFANGILVHNCLIIDDYFRNIEAALSETQRAKLYEWYLSTSSTRLTPTGAVVIMATRWHPKDLIGRVLENAEKTGEAWRTVTFPALGDNGAALWPEQWPAEKLEAKRREYYSSGYPWMWEALYQQNPPEILDSEWPPEYFDGIWVERLPTDRQLLAVALDPSLGKSSKADYSAFVAVAKGNDGRYYVDANISRRPSSKMVSEGVEWMAPMRPDAFGCETNQFQDLLRPMFESRIGAAGLTMHGAWGINNTVEKIVRIRSLTQLLATKRLLFVKSPGTMLLVEQLRGFPSHRYDDGPDALEMAIRLCEELLHGHGRWQAPRPEVYV